jgi:2,5-dichlorohydroquinone reductive dechlorinase
MDQSLDVLVRDLRDALGCEDQGPAAGGDPSPRYEVFHAANSICSQKVRTVLAQHGAPYLSRPINIFAGQTYLPSYVRIRMVGCRSLPGPLASVHTGTTSVTASGCDPAVVPTLVDWQTGEVVVDSKRICLHIDAQYDEAAKLRPAGLAAEIDAQMAIVDNLPNYQMLMGAPPSGAQTPVMKKGGSGPQFSKSKVERCERYLAEFADDPELVAAYSAKLNKELMAANELFSADAMKDAYGKAEASCRTLEETLKRGGGAWLFGETVTMADLFWGIELLRMKNLGADVFWDEGRLPRVAAYVAAAEALPSIRTSVLEWPGARF